MNSVFWTKMADYLRNGDWIFLDVVAAEVSGRSPLQNWITQQRQAGLITTLDSASRARAAQINNTYPMIDQTTLRSTVDTYLVAYAETNNLKILSREGNRDNSTSLYKIPDVCNALGIAMTRSPKEFLRDMRFSN